MKDFEGVGGGLADPLGIGEKQVCAALAHGWGHGSGDGDGNGNGDDKCTGEA